MRPPLLIALGLPIAYLLISTAILLNGDLKLPTFLQRLTAREALLWNTMVGLSIGLGALQWALRR